MLVWRKTFIETYLFLIVPTNIIVQFAVAMAGVGAGAGAEIMDKGGAGVGAGAKNNYFRLRSTDNQNLFIRNVKFIACF